MGDPAPRLGLFVFLSLVVGVCLRQLAFADLGFSSIALENVGGSKTVGPWALCGVRALFAAVIFATVASSVTSPPIKLNLKMMPTSRLASRAIKVSGLARLTTFTVQTWTLLGLYFACGSCMSAAVALGADAAPRPLLACAWVAFEVSWAAGLLVAMITTFVLIPAMASKGDAAGVDLFFTWKPQLMHNANVVMLAVDLYLNDLPISAAHLPFGVLWGIYYVFFAWCWMRNTQGVIYYAFLDPTLDLTKSVPIHVALLAVFAAFFLFGVAFEQLPHRELLLCVLVPLVTRTRLHGPKPEIQKPKA
ncbi:hypothetical protein M885DRAFT_521001 [Pelagophyceae sp. CCMP2097]|nr:hypothetical protein M885DRAFT_521001 [Pelagophyceae sp. CCMP2097]